LATCFLTGEEGSVYHKKSPDSVVGEDGAGEDEHGEAYEAVELVGVWLVSVLLVIVWIGGVLLTGLPAPIFEVSFVCSFSWRCLLRSIVWVRIDVHGLFTRSRSRKPRDRRGSPAGTLPVKASPWQACDSRFAIHTSHKPLRYSTTCITQAHTTLTTSRNSPHTKNKSTRGNHSTRCGLLTGVC
jgi:hypothetical protein